MTTRIKLRRDTAANWTANNPVLALGEPGLDTDNNAVKYGDGVTAWNSLPYSGEGATENIWLAVGSDCNQGHVKVSRDGIKWTESFAPMPRYSGGYNWQNFWWAKPLGGKVIYDMYVDYLGDETLGWSDNALDYPLPVTFTNAPTTDEVDSKDWWDAYYINGKYIAVGGYFESNSNTVERPMFATSDDGKTWTYGTIDDTFTSQLVNDADASPTGIRISSVAYNGVGYLFALDWDYYYGGSSIALIPPGFFYVTSLSSTLNSTNHVDPSQDHNAGLKGLVWNNDHWAAYGHQNVWDRASLFINPNVNPATGNWTEISLNVDEPGAPQIQAFGSYPDYGNTLAAFTTGKIGDDYWEVMGLNNGRVMATKDKGVTWIGSVPFNMFNSIDSIDYTSSNTRITFDVPSFDGGTYSPQEGERIEIRYGNVEQLQGVFWLGTEVGADGDSRTWTIFANRALTTPVNSSAWFEDYNTSYPNGYALITFSRDSDGEDPLTYGGFDQLVIADGKIVAINGAAWACSTDLLNWTLSVNIDVYTSQSYGTSGLAWGSAGSTNRSSLTYVSDTHLATEAFKEEVFGPNPPADLLWYTQAWGNYVNQLVLAENFKVSLSGGNGFFNSGPAVSMGMEPTGKWWIGYDNRTDSQSGFGNYVPPSISCEDEKEPGYEDVVIRTDRGDDNHMWVFDRNGSITFPTKTTVDYDNRTNYTDGPTLQLADNGYDDSVIITGPAATTGNQAAKRLVIQGQPGWRGTATQATGAEGGDVYIWAGYGGEGSENTGPGGDVKLKGGKGGLEGGYVRLEAGNATVRNGAGGFVDITAGSATTGTGGYEAAYGGSVNITAGQGYGAGGSVNINAGEGNIGLDGSVYVNTLGGDHTWEFKPDGSLTFPAGGKLNIKSSVPAHSYGVAGDVVGMIAFDSTYFYYCTADYVNTSTDIWKRVALDATAW
jgi:hypothetical protein